MFAFAGALRFARVPVFRTLTSQFLQWLRWRPCSHRHLLPSEMHRRVSPLGQPLAPMPVTVNSAPFGHFEATLDGAGGGWLSSSALPSCVAPSGMAPSPRGLGAPGEAPTAFFLAAARRALDVYDTRRFTA